MREILFKAKPMSNREEAWVLGYVWDNMCGNTFIRRTTDSNDRIVLEDIEVDPETVCQFIGKTDKSGKKIFEWDLVKLRTGRICMIVFVSTDGYCGFDLEPIAGFEHSAHEFSEYADIEVVGNIYDK